MFKHSLIITPQSDPNFGAGVMNRRNLKIAESCSLRQTVFEFPKPENPDFWGRITKYYERAVGYVAGVTRQSVDVIEQIVQTNADIDAVWLNNSLFGLVAKRLKKSYPHLKVIVFFHNAESVYVREQFKVNRTFKNRLEIYYHSHAERMSLRHSDTRFVLSRRDNEALSEFFPAKNEILPLSLEDAGKIDYQLNTNEPIYLLFVGSAFFANIEGLRRFSKEVMPHVKAQLTVVGNGMEKLKKELETENIRIFGRADSLKPYYEVANVVVSPIFYGSGMKTKTAEALMFGLPIVGTAEAFAGFDDVETDRVGKQCETAEEFISALRDFAENRQSLGEKAAYARRCFEQFYSLESSIKKANEVLFEKK